MIVLVVRIDNIVCRNRSKKNARKRNRDKVSALYVLCKLCVCVCARRLQIFPFVYISDLLSLYNLLRNTSVLG